MNKHSFIKSTLAIAVSSAVVAFTQPAFAKAENKEKGLETIVVTASKHAKSLQEESRSIVAVSADDLANFGLTDPQALQDMVPGLTINKNGELTQISIRGVGDRTITNATEPAVAINLDGVYVPRSYQSSTQFFDLERIEVLKGPQGTLYGRNATAGAINLITAKPDFDNSGFIEAEAGNFSHKRLTGAVNLELSDTVAMRISGQMVDRDGYLSDGYNDDESEALRLGLLYKPNDDTSLLLNATYSHIGGKGTSGVIAERFVSGVSMYGANPSDRWAGPTHADTRARVNSSKPGIGDWHQGTEGNGNHEDAFQDIDVQTLSATLEHNLGWADLTVVPSYIKSSAETLEFGSMIVGGYSDGDAEQVALEVRLSSQVDSAVQWVIGLYKSEEDIDEIRNSSIPFGGGNGKLYIRNAPIRETKAQAIFGELNASLTDDFRLIAGLRYNEEDKRTTGYTHSTLNLAGTGYPEYPLIGSDLPSADEPSYGPPVFGAVTGLGSEDVSGTRTDDSTNYRLGFEYDVNDTSMVYASVASGFKAGGFFDSPDGGNNSYKPEELLAYSLGTKSRFFDNLLQINAEAFYWDYTDKQETFLNSSNVLETANAGEVTLSGVELSIIGQITEEDTLSFFTEYVNSEYDEYVYDVNATPLGNCTLVNNDTQTDCSGNSLVRAPEWSGRLAYSRIQDLGDSGYLTFNVAMTFSSSYYLTNDFSELGNHPSYQTYDTNLTWESVEGDLTVTAWMKNITDENIYHGGVQSGSLPDGIVGQIGAPRTFGVRARYNF